MNNNHRYNINIEIKDIFIFKSDIHAIIEK